MKARVALSCLGFLVTMDHCNGFQGATNASPSQGSPPHFISRADAAKSTTVLLLSQLENGPSHNTVSVSSTKSLAAQQAEGTYIIGGGLAGLSTAAALSNIAGLESVHVLEKSTQDRWESPTAGAAVQLGPNGLRALRAIGGKEIVSEICREGTCLEANAILLPQVDSVGENVMILADTAVKDTGLPQVLIRWGVLRSILVKLLPQGCITTGAGEDIAGYSIGERDGSRYVEPVTFHEQSIVPSLNLNFSLPPLLVAADGIYSVFQSLVHSGKCRLQSKEKEARRENIRDGGRVNIKGVAPVNLGPEFRQGTTYSYFSPGGAAACFAGPAGMGYTYWAISIADEPSTDEPVRPFQRRIDGGDKSALKDQLLSHLTALESGECQFAIDLIEKTDADTIFVARSEERKHVGPSLVSEDGMIVLVGDAAHAMSPAYGQAANFAFEDAATLATCIRDSSDLQSALKMYSSARVSRCTEMQRRSANRTTKATRGEKTEDISKWIFQWTVE